MSTLLGVLLGVACGSFAMVASLQVSMRTRRLPASPLWTVAFGALLGVSLSLLLTGTAAVALLLTMCALSVALAVWLVRDVRRFRETAEELADEMDLALGVRPLLGGTFRITSAETAARLGECPTCREDFAPGDECVCMRPVEPPDVWEALPLAHATEPVVVVHRECLERVGHRFE